MNPSTVFLYQLIGPVMLILGVGMALNTDFYLKYIKEAAKSHHFVVIGSLINLVIGMSIILTHNLWGNAAEAFISLFGWIALWKGAWIGTRPNGYFKLAKLISEKKWIKFMSFYVIALGLLLSYIGFIAL
jgi:hypothetical protein